MKTLYQKQCDGEYIEVYYKDELIMTFEYFSGVFIGTDFLHNSEEQLLSEIVESLNIRDEFNPLEVEIKLEELKEELESKGLNDSEDESPNLVIVGRMNE